jgi:DNA topoisomerase-3
LKLIIAEKPSLARNIVAGIDATMKKANGYYEGGDYIVTWAFGHLFSLCDIEDYQENPSENAKWTIDNLPCFPSEFKFRIKKDASKHIDTGAQKQFEIIKRLCLRADVDTIVNAGDADREGEIIVRLCVNHAMDGNVNKNFLRLWLPDQTPETVSAALKEMKEENEYQRLADEGFARTYIDWLYGVNLTRYATLKTGKLLRIGRVIIPIVKAIYDREMAIRNFVPDIYYGIVSKEETAGEVIELVSKKKFEKNELDKAKALCDEYNASKAIVVEKKRKKDTLSPGKLYSLSKLQNMLGKKYKMSMTESLEIIQKLYENGYVTYPRTNSEYLATAEKDKIKKILGNVAKLGYPVTFKDKKTIFDDSKIESHSALTPTYKIPSKDKLSEKENLVYSAIFKRFVAVFCSEDCIVDKTEIKIDVGGLETFVLKGTVIVTPGWTKYDDFSKQDKILPNLKKGDEVNIAFAPKEKETSPPKRYTIETLNNYLKNPFREEQSAAAESDKTDKETENDEEDYRAIFEGLELGTEATRTGIIDNAKNSGYIELKKDTYSILPDGEYLIKSLIRLRISMDKYKTSEMGRALKKVYNGKITVSDSVALAQKEIDEIFNRPKDPPETDKDTGFYGDIVGKCPLCGKDVIRYKTGYSCSGYKEGCEFSVYGFICRRVISKTNMEMLLSTKRTSRIKGFISKNGKPFDAYLKLEENGKVVFDFSDP